VAGWPTCSAAGACSCSPGGTSLGDVLFPSLLAAVGLGFSFVPVTIAAVTGVTHSEAGLASGLIDTSQQIGGALGLAVLSAISTATIDDVMAEARGDRSQLPVALADGFGDAFLAGSAVAFLGALLALTLISGRDSKGHVEAVQSGDAEPVPVPA